MSELTLASIDVSDISYTSGDTIATVTAYDSDGDLVDPSDITWTTDNGAYHLADGQILGMSFYVKGIDDKIPGK